MLLSKSNSYCNNSFLLLVIMNQQQNNELCHASQKEAFINMIKAYIRQQVPEPQASIYCKQFDDIKNFADIFEHLAKLLRG